MIQEEKLEEAKRLYETANADQRYVLESLFPELAESKDERVRKEIMELVMQPTWKTEKEFHRRNELCTWLEKQGEQSKKHDVCDTCDEKDSCISPCCVKLVEEQGGQKLYVNDNAKEMFIKALERVEEQNNKGYKLTDCDKNSWWEDFKIYCDYTEIQNPADKVEPKFHKGDWIVQKSVGTYKIIEVCESWYEVVDNKDFHYSISFDKEYMFHIWTIQDAKDGDVLQLGKVTAIFKEFIDNKYCKCYCSVYNGGFEIQSQEDDDNCYGCGNATPATKEQREQLEKAMAEDGYEWDSEMKELKKIEQKPVGFNIGDETVDKDAWSEDDEAVLDALIQRLEGEDIHVSPHLAVKCLKSLKYRVQPQPKQDWSEEDERQWNNIWDVLDGRFELSEKGYKDAANWFLKLRKSLRPQNTWKPSDEHYELEEFAKIVRGNLTGISEDIQEQFEAKYLQLTGNRMYGGFKD